MKVQLFNSVKLRTVRMFSECGAAQDVTSLTISSQRVTHVGVRRRLILDRYLAFLLTPVVKRARGVVKGALILATQPVTPALVHHVPLWAQHRTVSAERIHRQSDVSTPITLTVGAVERFVAICSLAGNIHVRDLVTKVFADLAKKKLTRAATAEKSRIRFCVAPPKRK